MVLFIDNYDSFSFNLVQIIGGLKGDVKVLRNDDLSVNEIKALNPSHIVISPGPGFPKDAGVSENLIKATKGELPILGVCLGHQAVCEVFGGEITHAKKLMHGKSSPIHIANGSAIFKGLPPIIEGARYHSLIARRETLPDELLVIAEDVSGEVMGVKHANYEIYGVQFHPESILTPGGALIVENFLNIEGGR